MWNVGDKFITGHGDPIPRFANHYEGNHLIVPVGEIFELNKDEQNEFATIEVNGTLLVRPEAKIICDQIQVLPGARFEIDRSCNLLFRDKPLGDYDPYQIGRGILNHGTWICSGEEKTPWTYCNWISKGDVSIRITSEIINWQVGDVLHFVDTRHMFTKKRFAQNDLEKFGVEPFRESPKVITAIEGNLITVDTPFEIDHLNVVDNKGRIISVPIVFTESRSIVLKAESEVSRGHTINFAGSYVALENTAFFNMGRTTTDPTDNTIIDGDTVHIGTNQIALYAVHFHHSYGNGKPRPGIIWNCYVDGGDIIRWGYVVHATADAVLSNNVAYKCRGAGFSLEDGNEVRNVFDGNLSVGALGNGLSSLAQISNNSPGSEGSGFWFHGTQNTFLNNQSWNNRRGFNVFQQKANDGMYPSVPGGEPDTPIKPAQTKPIVWKNNFSISNYVLGTEFWSTPKGWIDDNSKVAYNGQTQYVSGSGNLLYIHLRNVVVASLNGWTKGIGNNTAYTLETILEDCDISGCSSGIIPARSNKIFNPILANEIDIDCSGDGDLDRWEIELVNPIFNNEDLVNILFPARYRIFAGQFWEWTPTKGSRFIIRNWNGKNYQVYDNEQLPELPAPVGNIRCPEIGLTQWECWLKYGIGPRGGVCPPGYTELPGLENGVAVEFDTEPDHHLPNHQLLTLAGPIDIPIKQEDLRPDGKIDAYIIPSPHWNLASKAAYQIGDEPIVTIGQRARAYWYARFQPPIEPGIYTITTWILDTQGNKIPETKNSTRRTFFTNVPEPEPEPEPTIEELLLIITELKAQVKTLLDKINAALAALS